MCALGICFQVHLHRWQQATWAPAQDGLTVWQLSSPRGSNPGENARGPDGSHSRFGASSWKWRSITTAPLCWLEALNPVHTHGERIIQGHEYQEVGSQGTILEAAYNSNSCFHLYLLSTCRWIPMYPSMGLPDTSLGCLIDILSLIWKNGPPQHLLFPVFSILVNGSSILRDDWVKNLERSFTRFFLLYHLSTWPSK